MSIQINSNVTLQVVLAAATATNPLPCSASYVDQGGSGGDNTINTNGATAVMLVASPAASVERLVSNVSIPNADTASATVTVNKVVSGTPSRLVKVTLQPGYALYYDGNWRVMDPNGNFLCDVTVSSGSITSNQGTPAALANAWPVSVTDGTNVLGTSSHPIRIDPTGTTTQPVSVSNFPADQNVNLAQLDGSALAGPTAWGTAPVTGAQVLNVNANIVAGGGGGGGNVNVTEWNSQALGSPTTYGTPPTGEAVIGVNAFITNLPATQPVSGTFWQATQPVSIAGTVAVSVSNFPATQPQNLAQLAGSTLGAPSNYGTSPGAVAVQGVNAFVTNTLTVNTHAVTQSGTWTVALSAGSAAIGTVGVTSLPALPAGSNTIGAVTQASGPWTFNLTQVGGSALALGQAVMASSVPVTLASNQSVIQTEDLSTATNITTFSVTNASQNWGSSTTKYLQGIQIDLIGVTSTASVRVAILDGGGNTLYAYNFGALTVATTVWNIKNVTGLAKSLANAGGQPTLSLTNAITGGSVIATLLYT